MIETVNLGQLGMGYREIAELAEMLKKLAEKGELDGVEFDLETLQVGFDPFKPEVFLFDDYEHYSGEVEEDE